MYRRSVVAAALLLVGCAQNPPPSPSVVYKDKLVPVVVGCVVDRPQPVKPLNAAIDQVHWSALAPGAKAEAIRAQAGRRMNYEDRLAASAQGCSDVRPGEPVLSSYAPSGTPAAK